jgi:hypothetical protein
MYVSPDSPLPQNSMDYPTACQTARAQAAVTAMDQAVSQAYGASQMIAPPASFAEFGPGVVIDAQRSQDGMRVAQSVDLIAARGDYQGFSMAPKVVPLNVSVDEYESCCQRGTDALQPIKVNPPRLVMPPMLGAPMPVPNYGGLAGISWGNAAASRCPAASMQIRPGTNWRAVVFIGIGVLGVYALGRAR